MQKKLTGEFERKFVAPRQGRALIVGSKLYPGRVDRRRKFLNAIGVDMVSGAGVDIVHDMEKPWPRREKFNHIECMSVLEHTPHPWKMAEVIESILSKDGSLYISAPTVWRYHGYPLDYWRFTSDGIAALFRKIDFVVMRYESWDGHLHPIPKLPRMEGHGFHHIEIHAFGYKK